jgi:NAD(P)-dependent dehydrogenase (short-subunit alcohol dehydrogenase family)
VSGGWIDLSGRVAVVTGAGSGIGRACVKGLAAVGATIIALDLDEAAARSAIKGLPLTTARKLDVTSDEQWREIEAWIDAEFGRLDILVNSAGIVAGDRVGDSDLAVYERIFRVNVEGSLLGMRTALAFMRKAGKGSIINLSSTAALSGASLLASYGASKAAIAHYTRSAAIETRQAGHDIRINAVHPGAIDTAMGDAFVDMYASLGPREAVERMMTSGRFGHPEEIANLIVFLASDRASFISGASLVADRAKSS